MKEMKTANGMESTIAILNELKEDSTVPKNVRTKIEGAVAILGRGGEEQAIAF